MSVYFASLYMLCYDRPLAEEPPGCVWDTLPCFLVVVVYIYPGVKIIPPQTLPRCVYLHVSCRELRSDHEAATPPPPPPPPSAWGSCVKAHIPTHTYIHVYIYGHTYTHIRTYTHTLNRHRPGCTCTGQSAHLQV